MNQAIHRPRRALALRCALICSSAVTAPALAQTSTSPPAASTLNRVVITGNPLGNADLAAPVSVLEGDALVLKRGSSLGDTLGGLPGVSSTYFGPNANRPTIRGLDGDRVKVLSNAGASLDASSLSFDHAVPIDPLIVDRIEVLRGPGALFYGGSAVGGVVNTLDNRIPKQRLNGVSGAAELRLGGADSERGGAALVEFGNSGGSGGGTGSGGDFALHADVFGRNTSDLKVPRYTPVESGAPLPQASRVRNSASETRGGALGGSLFFRNGYIGVSADTYDSRYGTVAEADVVIKMKRQHVALASEIKGLSGPVSALRLSLNSTDYEHREVDGAGVVGTTFKTRGNELRVEAEHAPLGPVRGVLGLQAEDFDFSALGDEAFVPSTRTRRQGLFALEELTWAGGTLSAGARLEHARIGSKGDTDPAVVKFGAAAERSFSLRSISLANVYKLNTDWAVSASVSRTERAPTSFELYANGVHAATAAFERGDSNLGKEKGMNLELALQWKSGSDHLRLGAFSTRFSRFISLEAAGTQDVTGADGQVETFPLYVFKPVRARLNGLEFEGRHRVAQGRAQQPWTLDASGKLDLTRARNTDTGEPLPRVAPLRLNLGLDAANGPWGGRIEVDHNARQARVPATDTATAGYTIVNLSLTRRINLGDGDALWFVKLTNLGDTLAHSASSVQTIRSLAPLPGRGVKTGLRVTF